MVIAKSVFNVFIKQQTKRDNREKIHHFKNVNVINLHWHKMSEIFFCENDVLAVYFMNVKLTLYSILLLKDDNF